MNKEDTMLNRCCALFAVMVLVAVASPAQDLTEGAPKVVVPEKIKDFGTVPQGETVKTDFVLRNQGTKTLVVKAVRPTCGCTVADFDTEIQSGREGKVRVKLDTTGFSGPISKSILIITNDPQLPTMSVIVKARVQPYLEVLPRPLVRFNAIQNDGAEQVLTLVGAEGQRFEATRVESSDPSVEAELRKVDQKELMPGKGEDQYEVTVRLADTTPVGTVNAQLTVHTNHAKAKRMQIKVFGIVRAVLHVTPSALQFGSVEAALQPGRNVIVVNNRASGSVEVTDATVDDPAFTAEVYTVEQGQRYQVAVTVVPTTTPGTHDSELIISTTDPEYPELRVPIRANIR
jgi:hypothetical protein